MSELMASRTLLKSPPELWSECSDAASLARHLGEFGEIRVTRLEPETAVAWEGEQVSGTVRLEPSGWGTKVTLTAEPESPPAEVEEPEPEEPVFEPRRRFLERLLGWFRRPDPEPEQPASPEGLAAPEDQAPEQAVLVAALDSLGSAHHRPFSRG